MFLAVSNKLTPSPGEESSRRIGVNGVTTKEKTRELKELDVATLWQLCDKASDHWLKNCSL